MTLINEINQYKKNNISNTREKDCLKEKCKYYNLYCEATIDGCMFGASGDDKNAPCGKKIN